MNRKHFTVGDPMVFPIVKMEKKTLRPLAVGLRWPSSIIQQCLSPPLAPPQIAAPTV